MASVPTQVAEFLQGERIAVVGVSRGSDSAANAVYQKLRKCGYEAMPVNPNATQVEGVPCYPNLASIPGRLDGVVIATHPAVSVQIVQQAADRQVRSVWFHRSFGHGSVSDVAVQECAKLGIPCIVGGCPLMYCKPVDLGHRCIRAWLNWRGQLPR